MNVETNKVRNIVRTLYRDNPEHCKEFLIKYWLRLEGGERGNPLHAICRKHHARILYGMITNVVKKDEYELFEKRLMKGMARAFKKPCKKRLKSTIKTILYEKKPLGFYVLCRLLQLCSGSSTTFRLNDIVDKAHSFIREVIKEEVYKPSVTKKAIVYRKRTKKTACLEALIKITWEFEGNVMLNKYIGRDKLYKLWISSPNDRFDFTINGILYGTNIVTLVDLIITAYLARYETGVKRAIWREEEKIKEYVYNVLGYEDEKLIWCIKTILKEAVR